MAEYPGRALIMDSAVQVGIAGGLPSSFVNFSNSEPCVTLGANAML